MSEKKMAASLSLDADNLWAYMKIHGEPGWEGRPSYLDVFVPYILDVLDRVSVKITFFIVGADAAEPKNGEALKSLVAAGHEVGNHSFEHEPWLQRYSKEELEDEIGNAHDAILDATGVSPIGFRGPGFSWSPDLCNVLHERGYVYDASTLPTYLGPLARAYYFWSAKLDKEERKKRKDLFGKLSDGLRPVKPYAWNLGQGRELLEIPVTTIPVIKTPFHFSYLLYLARFSESLMMAYLQTAIWACKLTRTEPSFLLHPLDVIGCDQVSELDFFPGMDVPGKRKTELLVRVLEKLKENFEIIPMGEHARRIEAQGPQPLRVPG